VPAYEHFFEKHAPATRASVDHRSATQGGTTLINGLSHTAIWVLDQDEALAFYTGKLGFEVSA
jgi:hypothetical protein